MKFPKGFTKMNEQEKREWVASELRKVRQRESELMKLSRELVSGTFSPLDYERPDLEQLKTG